MKNIFSKTTEKRTQNGLKTDSKRTNYGIRILIFAFLTLGVGQMWADDKGFYEVYMVYDKNGTEYNYTYNGSNGSMDLGTITSSFKIKKMYLKVWDTWGDQAFEAGSSGLGYKTQSGSDTDYKANNRTSKSDNNYELQHTNMNLTIASYTNPSGNYTFTHWWFADGTWTDTYYLKNGSSNCAFTYKIAPPAVKSSSVAISATNTAPGSGTGLTSESPITLISGMASTLTITATQNHTDANSALWCKFGTGSYSSTTTYNIASGTTTSNQTLALAVKYRNNSASLDGAETTTNIYYKWAAPAPAITFGSVTPTTLVSGSDVTLVGTRHNSSNTISFQYSTNDGASWSDITPKTSSLSSNTLTATWTIPEAHGATQTYIFRAKLAEATPIYSSASSDVTVYGKKTIHVRNINDWDPMKVYRYSDSAEETTWPGNTTGLTHTQGQWYDVVLTSQWPYFILDNNNNGSQIKGNKNHTYSSSISDGGYYTIQEGTGTNLTLTSTTAPATPTATTNDANEITSTTAKFNYSVSANRDKTTPGIAFKQSDDDIDAAIIYSSGTKVAGSATNGNASGSTAAQTITPGKKYYYVAYGTNGFGTSYGTVKSFVAPYKVTITKPTGCSAITPGAGTQYVHIGDEISSTAATGYTFSSWSLSKVTLSSPTTTTGVTTSTITAISADNGTIQPVYTENMTTVNLIASPADKGTFTSGGTVTSVSAGVDTHPTVTAVPGTGYHLTGIIWSESSAYISISPANTASTTITATGTKGNSANLTATFTPNTYKVQFHRNGGAGDVVKQDFTYDVAQNLAANTYTKTGYTFAGWALTTDGAVTYTDGAEVSNLTATQGATFDLYAIWNAKQCPINFDFDATDPGHGSHASATSSTTATYAAAMTSVTPPTAANGWAFMGYFDAADGEGTQYYTSTGASARAWDKDTESTTTLYAYYKKAEITEITFSPGTVVENNSTVTVTATISPAPTGTTSVCWRVLYDNDSPLDPQPEFDPVTAKGNSVSFTAPNASGMYKVEAKLHTGSSCGGGTLLSTRVESFQVAGSHTVTIAYKQGSTSIKASTSITARPLDWSEAISAPEIFGYTFDHWTAGDGITLSANGSTPVGSDESSANPIYIKANYNGTLTANYTQKNIVYFKDNLGWTDPDDADAHIYVNLLQSDYWNNDRGSGNQDRDNRNLAMARVPGTTDIFYFDYGSKPTSHFISFTKESMGNSGDFYQDAPNAAHVVFPSRAMDALTTNNDAGLGFYTATPMFVPLATQTPVAKNNGRALYYNDGYWTKYLPGTGYTLQIYNESGSSLLKTIAFTSADELMQMKAVADLEGGHTYKFQLKRDGDVYYGNGGTMTYTDHGQNTAWDFYNNSPFKMCTIKTNAAGDYTFNLSYSPNSSGTIKNRLRIAVDYPVASGDYRLVYTDDTRSGRIKPSAIIPKENDGTAIVSFFVRKNQSPVLRIQQATVALDGTITWKEYPTDGTPTNQITGAIASAITGTGVWNFNLVMNGSGALSVASAEEYDGEFYIRTDAANSKWDNYRTDPDHVLTSSDYLKSDVGYTHYYTHWVNKNDVGRKNVKFCIANDYSPCISDTLAREAATGTWANIATWMEEGGDLKRNANVRFMWDEKTNNIARAYIDGAQGVGSDNFLKMLSSDGMIKNADGSALSGGAVYFTDNQNWIYEANIKAQPNAQIKLISNWGTGGNTITQYFKGTADATEALIGGSGSTWYNIRLLYDFKTNRLVAAYIPSGEITNATAINADVMFIREHQGDIAQLTFSGAGTITNIKTAYGVLRFNKWTLNNKEKTGSHTPLDPELSIYERSLYWISFPFRVKLSEVFGFGTYMNHWAIQRYDGAGRAAIGHFLENGSFWRWMDRSTEYLEPNQGYLLSIDVDLLGESSDVWGPESLSEQIELYFPSYGEMPNLTSADVEQTLPAHTCTINRAETEGLPDTGNPATSYNRTIFDSHWNVMGVPTYVNTDDVTFANTTWESTIGPKFLYTWNSADNTISATTASGFNYQAMHSYMVQYYDKVTWSAKSGSPYAIVARKTYAEKPREIELRLELQQNEQMIDPTYVVLSNDEDVSANFAFGEDMCKEFNAHKASIFNYTADHVGVAGNTMPMSNQTTIIPIGLNIKSAGEYTFSIPEGTEGIGVTLVDNETGTRTSLSALDYTVTLQAGDYTGRFVLEISPIQNTPTGLEEPTSDFSLKGRAQKVMIDGILYIVKDGKMFDARGARVE